MSITVGDAVFQFLGDTTNLDAAFDRVGTKAQTAFDPATKAADEFGLAVRDTGNKAEAAADEVEEAGHRSTASMREARGEVALLGEEFGIRLPRHVRNFVAELPGVGEAMSAAFSATAILFLAQAVVEATQKVSNFIGNTLIFTAAMRAENAQFIIQNLEMAKQSELFEKAKAQLIALGDARTPLQKLTDQLADLNKQYDALAHDKYSTEDVLQAKARAITEEIALTEKQIEVQKKADGDNTAKKTLANLKQEITLRRDLTMAVLAYHQAENQGVDKTDFDEVRFQVKLKALQEEKAAQEEYNKDNVAGIRELNNQIQVLNVEHATRAAELLAQERADLKKTLDGMRADVMASGGVDIITPPAIANMLKGIQVARDLGITLKSDLVAAYVAAKKAQDDFMKSGVQDGVAQAAIAANILKSKAALDEYGQAEDKFKIKSHGIFAQLEQDSKTGGQALQQWKQLGATAFSDIAASAQTAIANLLLAQGSFGKALEKATEQVLASVASQAVVTGIFDLAKSFEAAAHYDYGAAGQYMAAAETMFVVAALAGGAAAGMSRGLGGSSSSNTQQSQNSNSNTSSQAGRSGGSSVGIQHFATGGLITEPTLAMMGEQSRKEAVLPLEDPQAMKAIGAAIGGSGGGGVTVHVHGHVIGAKDVAHLCAQISKRVNRGQANLQSSNTLRITKRSA